MKKYYLITLTLFIALFAGIKGQLNGQAVIDNDLIRVGNGTQASINNLGNMNQPWYWNGSTWRKLTFSSNALNASFAIGGDGASNWNLNGTRLDDPVMNSQVIDDSGFNYVLGNSGKGTGVVISTGTITINGQAIEVRSTYELMPNNSFIKVTTRLTNQSNVTATNVRGWIGTRDDWVGGTDSPTKTRGTIVDGAFVANTNAATRSDAIRITSSAEGVVFFTTHPNAWGLINNCCSWSNVINTNPTTGALTHSGDGSYGMYIRLNDLAPGASDEFTWFYAAGSLSELGNIINQVAQAASSVNNITCTGATFQAQANSAGQGYYIVVPANATAPTAAQVKAGVDYSSATVVNAGNAAMTANSPHTFTITGLSHSSSYRAYFVLEDNSQQFSSISNVNFTTTIPPSVSLSTTPSSTCGGTGNGSVQANVTGGVSPYSFVWTSGENTATITGKPAGSYTVNVSDAGGCPQATASANVGVSDNTPPVALSKNHTAYYDANGIATISNSDIDNGSTDDCELAGISLSAYTFSCTGGLQTNTNVTLTATDLAGNTATASSTVALVDTIKPIVLLRNIEVALSANGTTTITMEDVDDGCTDNCNIATSVLNQSNFDCSHLGENEVTATVTDAAGNSRSRTAIVTIVDQTAPEVNIENISIALTANGTATLSLSDLVETSTDACGISAKVLSKMQFDCSDLGTNVITFTAFDESGNSTARNFIVTVTDPVAPVAVGQNFTIALDATGNANVNPGTLHLVADGGSTDNCALLADGFALSQYNFDCNNLGTNAVTYTVTDAGFNTASSPIEVTVVDLSAPVAAAQNITLGLDANGFASITAVMADAGSTDNCGIATRTVSKSQFSCADLGTQQVQLTVTDQSGNSATATFSVTVTDQVAPTATFAEAPVLYLNEDGMATCDAAIIIADKSDNCAIASEWFSSTTLDCNQLGSQLITYFASDADGNIGQVQGIVMVVDTIKPDFTLPSIVLSLDANGEATLTSGMIAAWAVDNCGIETIELEHSVFSCSEMHNGQTTVTVTDASGNSRQRTLLVSLEDGIAPTVWAENVTLYLAADGEAHLSVDDLNYIASDNCAVTQVWINETVFTCSETEGTPVVIFATDAGGNVATYTFSVVVIDTIAPTMLCAPVTLCSAAGMEPLNFITATDNCYATWTLLSGPQVDDERLGVGNHVFTYMATDPSGNSSVCSVEVAIAGFPYVALESSYDVPLQGTITLVAGAAEGNTYLWSTGHTMPQITLTITQDMNVWVKATNAQGCETIKQIAINALQHTNSVQALGNFITGIYPVPSQGELFIAFGNEIAPKPITATIADLNGKVHHMAQLIPAGPGEVLSLDISKLAQGMYLLQLQSDQFNSVQRISRK